jgi:hypothetical protein
VIDLKVIPDDGDPYVLNVTSRDVMGWERVTKGASFQSLGETLNFTHLYALGHRAAKRTRVFDGVRRPGAAGARGRCVRSGPYETGSLTRDAIALAISARQPLSEVMTWDDRTRATAWELLHDTEKAAKRGSRNSTTPGPGGPQYSG